MEKSYFHIDTIDIFSGLFFSKRNQLDALLSGDEEAHSLGVDVNRLKVKILTVSALIVAFSVAFSGMIGFVGLIIPHTIRMLVGPSNTKMLQVLYWQEASFSLSVILLEE